MTATTETATIEAFIEATAKHCKTRQIRYAVRGGEIMIELINSGKFTADYLIALADGIWAGVKHSD